MDRMITKTLGEIYLKQGDLRKAYEIFKALAEQEPANEEVLTRLIELSERLGLSPPVLRPAVPTVEERIRILKKVLTNVRERRRR